VSSEPIGGEVMTMMRTAGLALLSVLPLTACIPYTLGQTAATLEHGSVTYKQSTYVIPTGLELRGDSSNKYVPRVGSDLESRYGLEGERTSECASAAFRG
jgi:hypothetical protein